MSPVLDIPGLGIFLNNASDMRSYDLIMLNILEYA